MRTIVLFSLLVLAACKKQLTDSVFNCDATVSYSTQIRPLLINKCTASGCHDGGNLPSLADYTVARDASGSIKTAVTRGTMPKNGTLTSVEKSMITCWIDNGSKQN